eukprot:418413-Pleurochrysis_carterae.AAC.1
MRAASVQRVEDDLARFPRIAQRHAVDGHVRAPVQPRMQAEMLRVLLHGFEGRHVRVARRGRDAHGTDVRPDIHEVGRFLVPHESATPCLQHAHQLRFPQLSSAQVLLDQVRKALDHEQVAAHVENDTHHGSRVTR